MSLVSEARSLGRIYMSLAFKGLKLCDFLCLCWTPGFFLFGQYRNMINDVITPGFLTQSTRKRD